jgi:hypothetical protein
MRKKIKRTLLRCKECKKKNTPNTRVGQKRNPKLTYASTKLLCINALGPRAYTKGGNRFFIVGIDHFRKIVVPLAVEELNRQAMCNFVETISMVIGTYKKMLVEAKRYFAKTYCGVTSL